ncbi:MAG: FIST N-terminal domain-containing protein [Pseudohongiellaceae bacterium]
MKTVVACTSLDEPTAAGHDLAAQIRSSLGDADAIIVFASPRYDHSLLLAALRNRCGRGVIVGASSAGEFTSDHRGEGLACVMAIRAPEMQFTVSAATGLSKAPAAVAQKIAAGFRGVSDGAFPHRTALVLFDALAGHGDVLIEKLTLATSGQYQFFGGGAGDNAQFQRTAVFAGTDVVVDGVVSLEILSVKPIGVGVGHGWEPASEGFRVTETDGMRILSLNGMPAFEAFKEHADRTKQKLDLAAPLPFFLHNVLGISTSSGHRIRVPLSVGLDDSILCAAEVPMGAVVQIMRTSEKSALDAAARATDSALLALGEHRPKAALFFDCVATRLRLGEKFDAELEIVKDRLGGVAMTGCNTHGQLARAEGQFQGFHNCTAIVCVFPE